MFSICLNLSDEYEYDAITPDKISILVAVVIGIPPLSLVAGTVLSLLNGKYACLSFSLQLC